MPRLRWCGSHWGVGSDDLCCPCGTTALYRVAWCVVLLCAWQDLDAAEELMGCASMARALLPWDDGERCPVDVLRSYVRAMLWV